MKKFILNSKKAKQNCLATIMQIKQDHKAEVIIQDHVDDQTGEQRAFFHILNGILAKEIGCSPDAMKIILKREAFGSEIEIVNGREVEVIKSTTRADKNEYSELIETTYRIGAEQGYVLPNPRYRG